MTKDEIHHINPTINIFMNHTSINKFHVLLALTCLSFIALGLLRLNDTSLYTDSTRYVIWGTSFSHANGFVDDTQPDPEHFVVNAPLYSVVLSPILFLFPYSLLAAKIWTLLLGVCSLILFYIWLDRRLGSTAALIGTLMLASSPLMLVMATEAMSEMCFMAMLLLAMILFESFDGKSSILSWNSISLLVILSFLPLLREVSVALVGAVVIILLLKKYYAPAFWIALGAGVLTAGWMFRNLVLVGVPSTSQSANVSFIFGHFVTPRDASLASELLQRAFVNIQGFYVFAVSSLMYPFPQALIVDPHPLFRTIFKILGPGKYILPIIVLPLAVLGINKDLKQDYKAHIRLLFCVLYALIIVLYPVQDIRFILPLLPFLIYYLLLSMRAVMKARFLQNRTIRFSLAFTACTLVILPNLDCDFELARTNWKYQHSTDELYQNIKQTGVNKEIYIRPWKLFGDWIKQNLPDSTVIASTYKELSIFVGDRKILEINYGVPLPMFDRLLRDNGVEYILSAGECENIRPYEFAMHETRRYWFEPVHSVSGLLLYRVHPSLMERPLTSFSATTIPDTNTAGGLLRYGRSLLLNGEYSKALMEFAKAYSRGSNPALTAFQITIAYAMSGQRIEATRSLERLYQLPQSTSYIAAATMHLHAMETSLNAMNIEGVYQRSQELFNVAAFYWNFGYRAQGYSVLRNVLKEDSSYFVALLWGWDYSKTLGDERQAETYLKILESVDRTNVVVIGFRSITAIDDTLRRVRNPKERSRLDLEKGRIYWSVGLYDEAFDCVEKSIGEDSGNRAAYLYLSELFAKTSKPWAIKRVRRVMEQR